MAFADRDEALARIGQARSFVELFDLANRAQAERLSWGDKPDLAAAQALYWKKFSFMVHVDEGGAVPFGEGPDKIARAPLLAASFKAAQTAASETLRPADSAGEFEKMFRVAKAKVEKAYADSIGEATGKRPANVFLASGGLEAALAQPRELLDEAEAGLKRLFSKGAGDLDGPLTPKEAAARLIEESLGKQSAEVYLSSMGLSAEEEAARLAQWKAAPSSPDAIGELAGRKGFKYIAAGPAGGMESAAKSAWVVNGALDAISEATGLPENQVHAGVAGLHLNLDHGGALAYYHSGKNFMGFNQVPVSVGHEWTHALDANVERLGTPAQRNALAALKEATQSMEPDLREHAKMRVAKLAEASEMVARFLEDKGKEEYRSLYLEKLANGDVRLSPAGLLALEKNSAQLSGFGNWLEQMRDPKAEPIKREGMEYAHGLAQGSKTAPGRSPVFLEYAKELDAEMAGGAKKGYWSSAKEMIARAAEEFFSKRNNPALAYADRSETRVLPAGTEAERLSALMENWHAECAKETCFALSKERTAPSLAALEGKQIPQTLLASRIPGAPAAELSGPAAAAAAGRTPERSAGLPAVQPAHAAAIRTAGAAGGALAGLGALRAWREARKDFKEGHVKSAALGAAEGAAQTAVAAAGVAEGIAGKAVAASRIAGPLGFALGFVGAGKDVYEARRLSVEGNAQASKEKLKSAGIRAAGAAGSILVAGAGGALAGSAFPVVGTVIGFGAGIAVAMASEWAASKTDKKAELAARSGAADEGRAAPAAAQQLPLPQATAVPDLSAAAKRLEGMRAAKGAMQESQAQGQDPKQKQKA